MYAGKRKSLTISSHLNISVKDALGVEVIDSLDDLLAHHGYQRLLHHSLGNDVCERSPLHELHDDE